MDQYGPFLALTFSQANKALRPSSIKKLAAVFVLMATLALLASLQSNRDQRKTTKRGYFRTATGRKGCKALKTPFNGKLSFCTDSSNYGSVCAFECDEGFSMRGSTCRRCDSNGRWSGYGSVCVRTNACLKSGQVKKMSRHRATHVRSSCCPAGSDGRRFDPAERECCHGGRLHWRTPLSDSTSRDCDCCAEHRNQCWTCCDEPILLRNDGYKKTGANFTAGAALDLGVDDFSDGFSAKLKVVGGGPASEGLRRVNAYLMYEDSTWVGEPIPGFPPVCGGVLIHKRWVLTARHCVLKEMCNGAIGKKHKLRVALGKRFNNYITEGDGQVRSVDDVACHPHYCNNRRKPDLNDIALLRLSREVDLSDPAVAIATLPRHGEEPNNWRTCTLTGWGITQKIGVFPFPDYRLWLETYRNATPPELQEVDVPIVANRRCQGRIRQCHLCAGTMGRDGCSSDSGSPLFCQTKDPRGFPVSDEWVVHGVFSSGTCGTDANMPSVYARVSHYRDWIDDVIDARTYT